MANAVATESEDRWNAYWRESTKPLASLVFVAPLLLAYEIGVLWLGGDAVRNGADQWLRQLLQLGGLGRLLLPLLTCGILLAWHHLRHERWRLEPFVCSGMCLESIALGLLLLLVASAHAAWFPRLEISAGEDPAVKVIAYLGAGVYEELLFRLMLLPVCIVILRQLGAGRWGGVIWSVCLTSLFFAAAHHSWVIPWGAQSWVIGGGEPWSVWTFAFRAVAGVFFSVVFLTRGFGIVVGTHAVYDLLVLLH